MTPDRLPPRPTQLTQLSALEILFPDFAFAIVESGRHIQALRIAGTGTLRAVTTASAIEMWQILSVHAPSPLTSGHEPPE